ncbi:MAG TPA: hypothetical protein VK176_13035 [Phycisphaerales bacterium]|nr:hypothetical protein [Phycisphaerales bacterium]
MAHLDTLLSLIEKVCTQDQIKALLRDAQERLGEGHKREVKVTGDNKADTIRTNLRRAVVDGHVPLDVVFKLLRDAEENGDQHIYYFTPATAGVAAKLSKFAAVAAAFYERHRTSADRLPRAIHGSENYQLVDFRVEENEAAAAGSRWMAKLYGRKKYRERGGDERHEDGLYWVPYKEVDVRTPLMAVYRNWGLLEMRVPRVDAAHLYAEMLNALWEAMPEEFARENFVEWSLTDARLRLMNEYEEGISRYHIGPSQISDGEGGTVTYRPSSQDENVMAAGGRARSLRELLKTTDGCRNLRVIWYARPDLVPPTDEIPTVMGAMRRGAPDNEVIFTTKVSAGTLDYVAYRLRELQQ